MRHRQISRKTGLFAVHAFRSFKKCRAYGTGKGKSAPRGYLHFEYFIGGTHAELPAFEPGHRNRLRIRMQAIRQGDLMAVRYDIRSAKDDFESYNVAVDPKEAHNPAYAAAWHAITHSSFSGLTAATGIGIADQIEK